MKILKSMNLKSLYIFNMQNCQEGISQKCVIFPNFMKFLGFINPLNLVMFSDSFPYYKVFVFIPNFVLIILNFFFESLEICKKLQASQNCNMSLHLHSLLWFTSSFSPVQARQQTKCLVSSSPYPSQSPLLTPGYVLKYKFIHHCGYTAMSFTRCQQHSIVTSCWPQLI